MEFSPYGFCHNVFKLLPQLKPKDIIFFRNEWAAAARIVTSKFVRLNIEIQLERLPWAYRITNKDNERITYTWNQVLELESDYVFFYEIQLTGTIPTISHEIPEEDVMTQIFPFVCQHIDNTEGCLSISHRPNFMVPERIFDIFKQESRIKFFKIFGTQNGESLLHYKIDTVSPLKLHLKIPLYDSQSEKKLQEKFFSGELKYLKAVRTGMEMDLDFAVKLIDYFKRTEGEKKFYIKLRNDFTYKELEPYVKKLKKNSRSRELRALEKEMHLHRYEFLFPGTSNKLTIIDHPGKISFEVS
ncbi:hypothetical protein L596_021488 [Steinernema carpocapsae]|uniref:DUF38 domain-containing protein n=1 Tax=Steinernema carpocapsae TaxID=34508 RepID=A0A4U5MJ94_STECR|nr:hypothetical protein L596_021488 [Steinernema carpocapsae]